MNKLFKFALAALPMMMLASCAKDDLEGGGIDIAQNSETRYLKVTLSSPNASPVSRAWTDDNTDGTTSVVDGKGYYADGTEDENKIRTLEFYFYDRSGQFHSYVSMTINDAPVTPSNPAEGTTPNIAAFYHCNVPVSLTQGQTLPTYVVCIVNSYQGSTYQGLTMQEAQRTIVEDIYSSEKDKDKDNPTDLGTDYFGMSNSVYYGTDPATGEDGVLVMAVGFTTDKLLTETELEVLNETDIEKFTINIPVERYAAKVNLDLSSLNTTTNIPDYEAVASVANVEEDKGKTVTPIKLKFTPKKWGVNATENTFYFLKSFRTADPSNTDTGEGNTFATLTEMSSLMNWTWNNSTYKRCFWARTPGYYKNSYPLTSDDIEIDDNGKSNYDLIYKSWNDCANVENLNGSYAEYVKETTMKEERLTGETMPDQYMPTASLPSVILLGQYQIEGASAETDFYIYGKSNNKPVVYSGETEIKGTTKIKDQMLIDQTIILREESGKYVTVNGTYLTDANKAAFTVAHPSEKVRNYAAQTNTTTGGELHIAADIVTLQLASVPNNLYFYDPIKLNYAQITNENIDHVNLLLYQNLGGAHYYQKGMAYFSAPIQHWGWYRSDNVNRTDVEEKDDEGNVTGTHPRTFAEWDWKSMKTGDFGIVRNHVYTMKIGKIEGLGTGIADPTEPIVPPADKVSYAVHFHINIQRWAVLPTQEWNW